VTCGGDGTVSATITACAGSSIPLGILPGGTANVFAKEVTLRGLDHEMHVRAGSVEVLVPGPEDPLKQA